MDIDAWLRGTWRIGILAFLVVAATIGALWVDTDMVQAMSTVAFVLFTWLTIADSRRFQRDQLRPIVDLFFERVSKYQVRLVLINTGQRAAYDIQIKLTTPLMMYVGDTEQDLSQIVGFLKHSVPTLPAGERLALNFELIDETDEKDMPAHRMFSAAEGSISFRGASERETFTTKFKLNSHALDNLDLSNTRRTQSVDIWQAIQDGRLEVVDVAPGVQSVRIPKVSDS